MSRRTLHGRTRHRLVIAGGGLLLVVGLFTPWELSLVFGVAGVVMIVVGVVRLCTLYTTV